MQREKGRRGSLDRVSNGLGGWGRVQTRHKGLGVIQRLTEEAYIRLGLLDFPFCIRCRASIGSGRALGFERRLTRGLWSAALHVSRSLGSALHIQ